MTKEIIIEEIINISYSMRESISKDNVTELLKQRILLDNLIKIYLKINE